MKKKYLLLADGSSPHTLKWAKELINFFDVYLITLNGISKEMSALLQENNCFILNESVKPSGGNYTLIFEIFRIKNIIKTIRPDYLNGHYLSSYGFLSALCKNSAKGMKLIQSTWGSDILLTPLKTPLHHWIARYALNQADYITADSYYVSDTIKKLTKVSNIMTFAFGFETIEQCTQEKERLIFSNRALKSLYNIDKLIHWFSKQDPSYRLIIANDGTDRKQLEALTHNLGIANRVFFEGYLSTEKQWEYYQKAKFFVSIPDSDATSVSLLEAMQYGTIPIVSNIPANREWILDGVNGVFFDNEKYLETLKVDEHFSQINQSLLHNKALFQKSIQYFVSRIAQ